MKRTLRLFCLLTLALLLPASLRIFRDLPADAHPYVEKKYAGWSGVLRAWVCTQWEPDGSFVSWLNACAGDFEKGHEGVYIEVTPVTPDAMRAMNESGIRPPELVFFSPGVLTGADALVPVASEESLRRELRNCGRGRALPVALGGYIWVYNRALCPEGFILPEIPVLLPDDSGRSFSAALIALMCEAPDAPGEGLETPSDPGIDLGLEAFAPVRGGVSFAEACAADSEPESPGSENVAPLVFADALERFIAGELAALPVSQRELSRLARLREAGRGPDWACAETGAAAYADQLLLAGAVAQPDGEGAAREALAGEFIALLCGEEMQRRLTEIGAFSVTGARIHSYFSACAPLDALLNGRRLIAIDGFSEYSPLDFGGIVRDFCAGRMEQDAAIAELERKSALQYMHN